MTEQTNGQNPFEGWTTIQNAAKRLGRRPSVLRYWARKGYINTYEIAPKVTVVNFEQVQAYAAEHKPHALKED